MLAQWRRKAFCHVSCFTMQKRCLLMGHAKIGWLVANAKHTAGVSIKLASAFSIHSVQEFFCRNTPCWHQRRCWHPWWAQVPSPEGRQPLGQWWRSVSYFGADFLNLYGHSWIWEWVVWVDCDCKPATSVEPSKCAKTGKWWKNWASGHQMWQSKAQ